MKFLMKFYDRTIKCFSLVLIAAILVYIPLKVLSYGWSPNIGTVISSVITQNSDVPPSPEIIVESIQSATPIYEKAVESNLINIVTYSFILFNIIGLCFATNHIAWFAALSLIMVFDKDFIMRLLSCSPIVMLSMLFITLASIFSPNIKKNPKTSFACFAYVICFLRCTEFSDMFTFDVINENFDYFWQLPPNEIYLILLENAWLMYFPIIICLSAHKQKTRILKQFDNTFLGITLCLQLAINFGYLDLAILRDTFLILWLTETISETIKTIECFKELRVKHCLSLFVLLAFTLLSTHDCSGRFSKTAIAQTPIDFSMQELKGWAPEPYCYFYNDNTDFAFSQYYANPNANYYYRLLDTNKLFTSEKDNILKIQTMLRRKQTPLPEYYQSWVNQMEPGDRLITTNKINGLENIEWLQLKNKLWLGRPKAAVSEDSENQE